MTANEYKDFKELKKESLRDNMTDIEVVLADLGEITARELVKKHKPYGLAQNKIIAKLGGHASKVAREDIEKNLGQSILSDGNILNSKYIQDRELK